MSALVDDGPQLAHRNQSLSGKDEPTILSEDRREGIHPHVSFARGDDRDRVTVLFPEPDPNEARPSRELTLDRL
jgi:hypothetical protein